MEQAVQLYFPTYQKTQERQQTLFDIIPVELTKNIANYYLAVASPHDDNALVSMENLLFDEHVNSYGQTYFHVRCNLSCSGRHTYDSISCTDLSVLDCARAKGFHYCNGC